MPTSLSLQDLHLRRRRDREKFRQHQRVVAPRRNRIPNYFQQQQYLQQQYFLADDQDFEDEFVEVEEEIIVEHLLGEEDSPCTSSSRSAIRPYQYHHGREEEEGEEQRMQQNIQIDDTSGLDIGSEQIIVESVPMIDQQQQEGTDNQIQHPDQDAKIAEIVTDKHDDGQHIDDGLQLQPNKTNEDIMGKKGDAAIMVEYDQLNPSTSTQNDLPSGELPIFKNSQMGVNQFSTEFLALTRIHRLQPKTRAILFDLLKRTMPEKNHCPQTLSEMRKIVVEDKKTHSFGTARGSVLPFPSTSKITTQTIRPKTYQYAEDMPSTTHFSSYDHLPIQNKLGNYNYQPNGDEEYIEEEILDDGQWSIMNSYSSEDLPVDIRLLLPQIFQTINRLTDEVDSLRSQLKQAQQNSSIASNYGLVRKLKKRVHNFDGRFGLHIFDENNQKVALCDLSPDELKNTLEISRNDENRLIYDGNDVTEMVLVKIDLIASIHNPSLCGRMVADVLFSPEYLVDKHILGEGQVSSRTRLETLPPDMTQLFYDSLRKLGISRIPEEDQEHWLYLARDGVNQRARDLKANRKRKFYIDDQPLSKKDKRM